METKLRYDRIEYLRKMTGVEAKELYKLEDASLKKLCHALLVAESLETPVIAKHHAAELQIEID